MQAMWEKLNASCADVERAKKDYEKIGEPFGVGCESLIEERHRAQNNIGDLIIREQRIGHLYDRLARVYEKPKAFTAILIDVLVKEGIT